MILFKTIEITELEIKLVTELKFIWLKTIIKDNYYSLSDNNELLKK